MNDRDLYERRACPLCSRDEELCACTDEELWEYAEDQDEHNAALREVNSGYWNDDDGGIR